MTQISRFWDGTTVGDATQSPYDAQTKIAEVLSSLCGADGQVDRGGVFYGALSNFNASIGAGQITIAAGRGISYGGWMQSDANEVFAIPTPGGATRVDLIVLRKLWSGQTVRLARVAGTEGAGVPTNTKSVGSQWDTVIWRVSITTAGVITLTDVRPMLFKVGGAGSGLDADLLDAQDSPFYLARVNHTGTQVPATISPQGAASGLDADTVDGLQAAALALSGHNHDATYVNEAQAGSITAAMMATDSVPTAAIQDGAATTRKVNLSWGTETIPSGFTEQTTTNTSYTDLLTPGPTVLVSPGVVNDQILFYKCAVKQSVSGADAIMSPSIAGAAAVDQDGIGTQTTVYVHPGGHKLLSAQASGATHVAKYRVTSGTGTFVWRRMTVVSLGI